MDELDTFDRRRRELLLALVSRVLSDGEMVQVEAFGPSLNIDPMVPYRAKEKAAELSAALLQQFRLRRIAETAQTLK